MNTQTETVEMDHENEVQEREVHIGSADIVSAPLTVAGFVDLVANMEDQASNAVRNAISTKFEMLIRSALVMEPGELNEVLRKAYQPGGRGGDVDKTLQNWASVVRNCYGAIRFAGVNMANLLPMGRDAASQHSAEALKEAHVKWNGSESKTAEEAAKVRKTKAELAAALDLMNEGKAKTQAEAIAMAQEAVQQKAAQAIVTKYAKRLAKILADYRKDSGDNLSGDRDILAMLMNADTSTGPDADM